MQSLVELRLRTLRITIEAEFVGEDDEYVTLPTFSSRGETGEIEEWLKGVKANLARKSAGDDRMQVKGVYSGECDLAIGNTYYMGAMLKNEKEPVQKEWANSVNMLFPNTNDRGTHVNLSGAVLAVRAADLDRAGGFDERFPLYFEETDFLRRIAEGPGDDPASALTERETEILKMVATGMSYKSIAQRLVLSHRTVQNHVQNTLRKLQMNNRVQLTRWAIEHGLDEGEA